MKEIALTKGHKALVDDEDFDYLSQFNWQARLCVYTVYAQKSPTKEVPQKAMHRLILGLTDPKILVDHIDRNGLNNQRANLRIVTHSQNQMNKCKNRRNTLPYKGVRLNQGRYKADIKVGGRSQSVGAYDTIEEAAIAYNIAAETHFGEYAFLNTVDHKSKMIASYTFKVEDPVRYVLKTVGSEARLTSLGKVKEVHEDGSYTVKFRNLTDRLYGYQIELVTDETALETIKYAHK